MSDVVIAGRRVSAGARAVIHVPVTRDLTGPVELVAHVLAGRGDGPTLTLLSMLHGNEWFSAVLLRDLLARLDPAGLSGNVIAIPVVNAPAMLTASRCVLDNADEPDANRSFGGTYAWLSNQITRVLSDSILSVSDAIVR